VGNSGGARGTPEGHARRRRAGHRSRSTCRSGPGPRAGHPQLRPSRDESLRRHSGTTGAAAPPVSTRWTSKSSTDPAHTSAGWCALSAARPVVRRRDPSGLHRGCTHSVARVGRGSAGTASLRRCCSASGHTKRTDRHRACRSTAVRCPAGFADPLHAPNLAASDRAADPPPGARRLRGSPGHHAEENGAGNDGWFTAPVGARGPAAPCTSR